MRHLKLFENFETVKYPNSIQLKLTEKWKIEKDIHNMPSEISLANDDELYSYIGNTKLDGFSGIIYFASRRDNLVFITGLDLKDKQHRDYDLESLTNLYSKSKRELDNSGLRKFSVGTCTLGELNNPDYTGPLEIGMTDHRGYFEIIDLK
jgi:hypothetical protein